MSPRASSSRAPLSVDNPEEASLPIVTVQQSPRDLERKRALVAGITQAFVDAYGVGPETVQVFIHEVDDENWAKSGTLAVDRGMG
jgi:4-oxalocrotonate tautomerase